MASFSRDSASVNGVAVRRLRTTFNKSSDILCICHTLCHLGEHFDLDILGVFLSAFIKLVYSSARAKTIWAALIGEAVEGFSEIRWWCKAMIMMQIARAFPKLKLFLDKLVQENVGDATTKTMLEIYANNTVKLKVQLAAMLDMRKVVSITHILEGDGAVILQAFPLVEEIRNLGNSLTQVGSLPNVEAVLRAKTKLEKGISICKVFPGHGMGMARATARWSTLTRWIPPSTRARSAQLTPSGTTVTASRRTSRPRRSCPSSTWRTPCCASRLSRASLPASSTSTTASLATAPPTTAARTRTRSSASLKWLTRPSQHRCSRHAW